MNKTIKLNKKHNKYSKKNNKYSKKYVGGSGMYRGTDRGRGMYISTDRGRGRGTGRGTGRDSTIFSTNDISLFEQSPAFNQYSPAFNQYSPARSQSPLDRSQSPLVRSQSPLVRSQSFDRSHSPFSQNLVRSQSPLSQSQLFEQSQARSHSPFNNQTQSKKSKAITIVSPDTKLTLNKNGTVLTKYFSRDVYNVNDDTKQFTLSDHAPVLYEIDGTIIITWNITRWGHKRQHNFNTSGIQNFIEPIEDYKKRLLLIVKSIEQMLLANVNAYVLLQELPFIDNDEDIDTQIHTLISRKYFLDICKDNNLIIINHDNKDKLYVTEQEIMIISSFNKIIKQSSQIQTFEVDDESKLYRIYYIEGQKKAFVSIHFSNSKFSNNTDMFILLKKMSKFQNIKSNTTLYFAGDYNIRDISFTDIKNFNFYTTQEYTLPELTIGTKTLSTYKGNGSNLSDNNGTINNNCIDLLFTMIKI